MNPGLVIGIIAGYFALLVVIAKLTSRGATTNTFFTGNKQSPWYLVAFGMIGASLSGVTFISVPGAVGGGAFSYFQIVLGYMLGYFVIATVLMPLYYKLNLISIYHYLGERFGKQSHKTGSFFFLMSRTIQASFRLFLVAGVLQFALFDNFGVPFWVSVLITIALIWIYTFQGGIKTIVWTDTLQTFFMLTAVVVTIYLITQAMGLSIGGAIAEIRSTDSSKIFYMEWDSSRFFVKQFISGALIAIVMTGLDQDMMQKNLTCKSLGEAKKNMFWFSLVLIPVNLLFLGLGALLYIYAAQNGIEIPAKADDLYPMIALNHLSIFAGVVFLLGIIAAAYSSADSALTALTTAFCVDFLNFDKREEADRKRTRLKVHIGFSVILFIIILVFKAISDDSVITLIFRAAGYTYGPILGLFAFGMLTKFKIKDHLVLVVCMAAPILSFVIDSNTGGWFGFFILALNGALTFLGLLLISDGKKETALNT
ncbi:MAG: sodium:solute symporter [Roseivirga sp.]